MYTGLYAGRRAPCLEQQCLAQLIHYETRISLRNVEQLSKIAVELKLGDSPLQELTGNLRLMSTLFKNQLRFASTLLDDDFIHIVGTVAGEETQVSFKKEQITRMF